MARSHKVRCLVRVMGVGRFESAERTGGTVLLEKVVEVRKGQVMGGTCR